MTIVAPATVAIAEAGAAKHAVIDYPSYPLVVLTAADRKEVARVTADKDGNFRVTLPPGNYILDAKGRAPGHVRAVPKNVTIISDQTVRADFELDTGIR